MTATATVAAPRGPQPPRPRSARETARLTIRTFGELFITIGVVLLLFCAYQLWWTNLSADRDATSLVTQFEQQHPATTKTIPTAPSTSTIGTEPADSSTLGIMYIPRLGKTWEKPLIEGVTLPDLHKGIGHFVGTAMPGQIGNFAVAGHRATNGQPFAYLDQMQAGDYVFIRTATTWYTYQVTKPWYLVAPTAISVTYAVPYVGKPVPQTPTQKLMTLTTCNPRWGHSKRLIVDGVLVASQPISQGTPKLLVAQDS